MLRRNRGQKERQKQAMKYLRKPTPVVLPPMFVLPFDTELVEAYAAIQALECAFLVIRDTAEARIGKYGSEVMAVEACLMLEKREHEGKAGANDPLLYRKVYIDAFNEMYPLAREQLLTGQIVIDPAWSEAQRELFYAEIAKRVLAPLT